MVTLIENKVRPSDFYWGIGVLITSQLLVMYMLNHKPLYLTLSFVVFIFSLFVGHNKRAIRSLDYRRVNDN